MFNISKLSERLDRTEESLETIVRILDVLATSMCSGDDEALDELSEIMAEHDGSAEFFGEEAVEEKVVPKKKRSKR